MPKKIKTSIYLDYAAATPLHEKFKKLFLRIQSEYYANPSSLHKAGVMARELLEQAREKVASTLHATNDSIIFTRGGTESINIALLGAARRYKKFGKHIVTTAVEHSAVRNTMKQLEKEGYTVTYLETDAYGRVTANQVKKALQEDTILVSIMFGQNELGSLNPIQEIGKMILQWRKKHPKSLVIFHTDAAQVGRYVSLDVEKLHVDLLSANGGKIHALKSSGILYKRRGVSLDPVLFGGSHEFGLRPGTEDVASSVVFAEAFAISQGGVTSQYKAVAKLRGAFLAEIKQIKDISIFSPEHELPHIVSISFSGCDAESLALYLDAKGVAVGIGSACSIDSLEPSHVLFAAGKTEKEIAGALRFSFGEGLTVADVRKAAKLVKQEVARNRAMITMI